MRRPTLLILAACVLSTACRTEPQPPRPRASLRPKASPARPAASSPASQRPAPVPLPTAAGPYATLTGAVRLEARYLVDLGLATPSGEGVTLTGAGRVLSDLGGGILAAQAPGLITDNGAGLLSDSGGALVSDQGGGLVGGQGAGLVANNSAGVVGQNGAGVIGQNGAGLGAPRAPGLRGAPRFGLAQALAPGELRAVAGAVILPIDLRTGQPVGTLARSDAAGAFAIAVPQALAGNVLLAVRVPLADREGPAFGDPRLRPNLLAAVAPEAPRLADEDTARVTRYLQACFVSRLEAALGEGGAEAVADKLAGARLIVPELKAVLLALVGEMREAARASGADKLGAERRAALARLMAHRILARTDLAGVQIDPTFAPRYPGAPEPAQAAMVDVMRRMREAASARLGADPQAFARAPYLAGTGFEVKRGADLPDFCVERYLIPDDPQGLEKTGAVLAELGFPIETGGPDQKARLAAAMYSLVGALAQALLLDSEARADAFAVLRDARP